MFSFSLKPSFEIFHILRGIWLNFVNERMLGLYVKYPLFFSDFNETQFFSTYFRKILEYQISLNPSSAGRVVPRRQADRRDEANRRFLQFCERT